MLLNICLICMMGLCIGTVILCITKLDKIRKELENLKANQFDAEQVLKMYEAKFHRPIIMQEHADIQCLFQTIEIPCVVVEAIKDGRISEKQYIEDELVYRYSKMILPYIEYERDIDYYTSSRMVKARLRVLQKRGLRSDN